MLYSDAIRPHTTFYKHIGDYGIPYFIIAFPLMILMHDTYFYWLHRLMHSPWLFKMVHLAHHKSTNPSPWAAYAFHPLEAIAESLIFVIFLFAIPVHSIHLTLFFVSSLLYNVYGHLGFEVYPKGFNKHWLGKWINTSTCHNQHHQYFKGNYGLYFTIWDRLMGTLRPDYDATFETLKKREKINRSDN
jgi:lathosterol oxidase